MLYERGGGRAVQSQDARSHIKYSCNECDQKSLKKSESYISLNGYISGALPSPCKASPFHSPWTRRIRRYRTQPTNLKALRAATLQKMIPR